MSFCWQYICNVFFMDFVIIHLVFPRVTVAFEGKHYAFHVI